MKKLVLTILFVLISYCEVYAQAYNFDVNFAVGTPEGSFGESIDRELYGVDLGFTYALNNSPLHVGVGLLYQNYGWNERSEPFSEHINEVDVRVRTTNDVVNPHFIARIEPQFGHIKPFVEGYAGFNYLYTKSSVIDEYTDDEIASSINQDNYAMSYGMGGGLKVKLTDDNGKAIGISLLLKGKILKGGIAEYLTQGDLRASDGRVNYNLNRSNTDFTTFNIGVVFSF